MKLSYRDALNVLGINGRANISFEDIKSAYRKACSLYHPDRNPAGLEMMKLVNAAYQVLQGWDFVEGVKEEAEADNMDLGEEMNRALNAVINLGLTIEVCGSWIWVSGETKQYKEILKEAGYRWAPKKLMWHWRPEGYKKRSKGDWDMDKIRVVHGSVSVKPKDYTRLGKTG